MSKTTSAGNLAVEETVVDVREHAQRRGVDHGIEMARLRAARAAAASAPQILASARTRSGLRPTSAILAPASASAKAAPRAAPPLPTISTEDFGRRSRRDSGPVTPAASVLAPRHLPALRHTVFTAPMRRASGSTTSR